MARPKNDIEIEILRDGVFIADDVQAGKGEKHVVKANVAELLIEYGFAKRV